MYATIITGALFSGIIFNDLIQNASKTDILKHFLFGLLSTTAMAFLTLRGAELAAWGLLLIPLLAVLIASIVVSLNPPTQTTPPPPVLPMPAPAPALPAPKPEPQPLINTPYMKTICYEVDQPPCPKKDTSKAQCTFLENGDIAPPKDACPKSEPEPVKPKCPERTAAPPPSPKTPAEAASLIDAVKSKLTPTISCPAA